MQITFILSEAALRKARAAHHDRWSPTMIVADPPCSVRREAFIAVLGVLAPGKIPAVAK